MDRLMQTWEFSDGDKIFKLLQNMERKINKPDLHSFKARIKSGTVFVEARKGEVYINHQCDNGDCGGWCGSYIAAANRLEMLGLDLGSVDI